MKKVYCEFCNEVAKKKHWIPLMVVKQKKPLMVFRTCEICGLYVKRIFHSVMSAFIKRMKEEK